MVMIDINTRYKISDKEKKFFRKNGFIKLKNILTTELLKIYGEEISKKVSEHNTMKIPMSKRNTYQKAFLQVMNLWRESKIVKEFVFGKRLAAIAADLLSVNGVRLYHDQALFKEVSGGYTPWHADQYYWPLEAEKTCTAWIPLQDTPLEMGPLSFAAESQNFEYGRDFKISDEGEEQIQSALNEEQYVSIEEPFELGEVSFHYGWTFHRAGPNYSGISRKAMTIIYMDSEMRLKRPENENQQADWDAWCPGARVGNIIESDLNPVLYSKG